MKKASLVVFASIFIYPALFSQKIIGNWKGNIEVNGTSLPIVFHFIKDAGGKIGGKWDSPGQNAIGLPYSSVIADDDSVHIGIKMINGTYEGKFSGDDSISGTWSQAANHLPLNFSRSLKDEEPTVNIPAPSGEREIRLTSAGGSRLYGSLLSKNSQQPLVIIVAGSGPTDRNGNSTISPATNEYQMLAYSLDSQNIATFRYDKRGIAKSAYDGMKESHLIFDDYVKDAEKIFDYLHDTLGFKNIYFLGHSEGSLIAMLASEKKKVKGYISVAGAGRRIDKVLEEQMQKQPLADSVKQQIPRIFQQLKEGRQVEDVPPVLSSLFRKSIQPYIISWLKYEPQQEIKKLNCPVLILQGACDIQVSVPDATNLHEANTKSTLDIIPGMSHTLKNAGTDCVNENKTYTDGSMPLDERLVEDIIHFIENKQVTR